MHIYAAKLLKFLNCQANHVDMAGPLASSPPEFERASEKFARRERTLEKREGAGATERALAVTRKWIPEFAEALKRVLAERSSQWVHRELLAVIRDLSPEVLALCILQGAQHSIGQRENLRDTALRIGECIAEECWAKGLTEAAPDLAQRIEQRVRRQNVSTERRQKYARTLAGNAGYKTNHWDNERLLRAGEWALLVLLEKLPDVFTIEEGPREDGKKGEDKFITLTEEAQAYTENFVRQMILSDPVWLPRPEAPKPWTGWNKGGTWDERLARSLNIMRSRQNLTKEAVRRAIRDGTMKLALDALNALQAVPWRINERVLWYMLVCDANGIEVKGLPTRSSLSALDDKPKNRITSGKERTTRKIKNNELRAAKRRLVSSRALFAGDMQTAALLADYERFWTAMNMDWRGRVYGMPNFNLQREDCVRALFLFADGEPIGEEGLYWLKVHLANCGDDNKISKQSFDDRVAWVDRNLSPIAAVASDPLSELWWTNADKPFMFLAACLELVDALEEGPTYITRLPVFFDGSCNGLQHLCAMTRAEAL